MTANYTDGCADWRRWCSGERKQNWAMWRKMEDWVELKSSSCATKVEEGNNSCGLLKDMWKTQESSDNARSKCYHQNLFQKEDPALLNYSLDRHGRDTIACLLFKDRLRSRISPLYHVNLLCSCWQLSVTLHFVFIEDSRHLGPGNCKSKSAKKELSRVRHSNSWLVGRRKSCRPYNPIWQKKKKAD